MLSMAPPSTLYSLIRGLSLLVTLVDCVKTNCLVVECLEVRLEHVARFEGGAPLEDPGNR